MADEAPSTPEINTRESEETFRLLFSNHPTPMWIYNLKTLAFLEVNDAMVEQYGYTREEFLGLTLKDIHPAEDVARLLKYVEEDRPSLRHAAEWRHLLKDGRIIDVEINSHTLDFAGCRSVLVTAHDITKRKRAEEVLQESEAHYRALVEGTPVIVYSFSNKRGGIYYSEHVTDILGYSPEQLCSQPMLWRNSVHSSDLSSLDQRDLIAVAGKTTRVEYRIKDAHDNWHWFDDRAFKYQSEEGEFIIEGRVLDITERKLTDAALRESEDRYHTLFDRMMDGIYRSTHDGRFVDVNPAMVRMFGYASREDLLGVDIKKDLYFALSERGSHILDTGQEETEVYRMRRKDGSEIWVEDHGYYVHDEQGNIIYHEGMLRDVTERKRAEGTLHQQFANLNSLYEMTAILSQTTAVEEVYETALDGLQNTLATERVAILLFDAEGTMRFRAWRGLSEAYRKAAEGHSPWNQDAQNPQPVLVPDVRTDPSLAHLLPVFEKESIDAVGFIPLVHQGILLGKFMIYYDAPHAFTTEEIQLAQTISRHVGFAIARKQAEEELRYANKSLESAHRELQQMFAHEQILARTDGLTGLYNRRHFFELAIREFNATVRYQRPLTIILFDVDGFKQANDTFGHAMGDAILAQIAQASSSQVRDVDVLARYGGDEFIILLPQTSVQMAFQVAERIRERVASMSVDSERGPLRVTISIGVAETIHSPQDQSVEDAIRRADQALYAAKAKGNNQTVIFHEK